MQAPERPRTAFYLYCKERTEAIIQQQPNLNLKERVYIISEEWKTMSSDMKSKYQKLAEEDKIRYEREKKNYEKH
jgi:hypothetical protein